MDALAVPSVVKVIFGLGILAWLATSGTRRIVRKMLRAHANLEKNELVKFVMPMGWGAFFALCMPCFMYSWLGVEFPADINLYLLVWSKLIIGGAAGLVSSLSYKVARKVFHAWIEGKLSGYSRRQDNDGVPPDADAP